MYFRSLGTEVPPTFHEAVATVELPAKPTIELTSELKAGAITRIRGMIAVAISRKFGVDSYPQMAKLLNLDPKRISQVFRSNYPVSVRWTLALKLLIPELDPAALSVFVNDKHLGVFIDGLERLTQTKLKIEDIKKIIEREAVQVSLGKINPFDEHAQNYVRDNTLGARPEDERVWMRRVAATEMLKSGISLHKFCEAAGISHDEFESILNGESNLLTAAYSRLMYRLPNLDPVKTSYLGSSKRVGHVAFSKICHKRRGYEISIDEIHSAEKEAFERLRAGEPGPNVPGVKLRQLCAFEGILDWESAFKKLKELGMENYQPVSALKGQKITEQNIAARLAVVCRVIREEKTGNRRETGAAFSLGEGRIRELYSGSATLGLTAALAFARRNPFLKPEEVAFFVWPSSQAAFLKALEDRGLPTSTIQNVQRLERKYAAEIPKNRSRFIQSVHVKSKEREEFASDAHIAARITFLKSVFAEKGYKNRKQAAADLGMSETFLTGLSTGRFSFSPKRAAAFFSNLKEFNLEYARFFVDRGHLPRLEYYLGSKFNPDSQQEILNTALRMIAETPGGLSGLMLFLKDFNTKTKIQTKRSSQMQVSLRRHIVRDAVVSSGVENRFALCDKWGINNSQLDGLINGRRGLTISQAFRIHDVEDDLELEQIYFLLHPDLKPFFVPVAKYLYDLKISEKRILEIDGAQELKSLTAYQIFPNPDAVSDEKAEVKLQQIFVNSMREAISCIMKELECENLGELAHIWGISVVDIHKAVDDGRGFSFSDVSKMFLNSRPLAAEYIYELTTPNCRERFVVWLREEHEQSLDFDFVKKLRVRT